MLKQKQLRKQINKPIITSRAYSDLLQMTNELFFEISKGVIQTSSTFGLKDSLTKGYLLQ